VCFVVVWPTYGYDVFVSVSLSVLLSYCLTACVSFSHTRRGGVFYCCTVYDALLDVCGRLFLVACWLARRASIECMFVLDTFLFVCMCVCVCVWWLVLCLQVVGLEGVEAAKTSAKSLLSNGVWRIFFYR
jgi:hypothetical protein